MQTIAGNEGRIFQAHARNAGDVKVLYAIFFCDGTVRRIEIVDRFCDGFLLILSEGGERTDLEQKSNPLTHGNALRDCPGRNCACRDRN